MIELTESQLAAVTTKSRETLVIAGAGAGKTAVLVGRIAHLLCECGVSASELMVLTFTRKAAAEMRERLEQTLAERGDKNPQRTLKGITMGTYHAVALNILRTDGERLGYDTSSLTVVTPDEADLVLGQVCRDLGYLKGKSWMPGFSKKAVVQYRDAYYNTGCYSGGPKERSQRATDLIRILDQYRKALFDLNAIDYGLMLLQARLLLQDQDVRESWQRQIKHVLVDEAQDCDTVQYDLHEYFAPPATLFLVGDIRQSIYGWRGARPELIAERHPIAEVIDLRECFRCGDRIIDAANHLISYNGPSVALPMIGATGRYGDVTPFVGRSADIMNAINEIHADDGLVARSDADEIPWGDIAVLTRRHRTLKRLSDIFTEAGIPHHRVGSGFDVCETGEFKLIHAALRLVVNPRDNLAFMRLFPEFGLSLAQYADVRRLAAEGGTSHWAAYQLEDDEQLPKTGLSLEILAAKPEEPVGEVVTPFIASIVKRRTDQGCILTAERELNDVYWFWQKHCANMSLAEALRWFALRDSQDDLATGDVVTLSTIHAAKGLEWPVVLIAEMNEGNLPSSQSLREEDGILEERRVAYVAMTRAKESLVLHFRRPCDQAVHKTRPASLPSRFLAESGHKP